MSKNTPKVLVDYTDLAIIADATRRKTGETGDINWENLVTTSTSIIASPVALPSLKNEGNAADLMRGKELIDDEGNVVTGSFTIDNELTIQNNLIAEIQTVLQGKMAPDTEVKLQDKTVNPSTSKQTVTADNGYDGLGTVTVNAMATVTQATPSISISSSGLITATATQSSGYVTSGTKSATKQLTTKAASTITPGTSNQTISSGTYLTGTQTIKGDVNLISDNIKSGVSIFGVNGSYEGSGGGSSEGGSVETWSGTIISQGPDTRLIYYTNPFMGFSSQETMAMGFTSIEIPANTLIFMAGGLCEAADNCVILGGGTGSYTYRPTANNFSIIVPM